MLNPFEKELKLRKAHNAVGTHSDREQERHGRNSGNIKKYGQHYHGTAQWRKFRWGGGQSLLNFRLNFQISDKPPHLHSKRLFLALF